jgi:hypothetical protein
LNSATKTAVKLPSPTGSRVTAAAFFLQSGIAKMIS